MSNCSKCKSKLIPVGFNPKLGKTVDRLYCIDLDLVCIDCLINGFKRAEAAESDRDKLRRQLTEAQHAIDVLSQTIVAQNNEIKRLSQQREDVAEYRAEIARLNQAATA